MHSNNPMTFASRCCQKFGFFIKFEFLDYWVISHCGLHLNFFCENLGAVSEEHAERFHQDSLRIKKNHISLLGNKALLNFDRCQQ
jgi:hypothetical protein